MVTLWIGDFRIKQLQNAYKAVQETAEYHYLTEDQAEYSWFVNSALTQISNMTTLEEANLVLMLGFIDCVYSSVWSSFKANKLAEQYANAINNFAGNHTNFNIYVCTVNPIDSDYPFAISDADVITENELTSKIELFNRALKNKCTVPVLDSYSYLTGTSFITRDGVRYTPDTCTMLHNYITANFKSNSSAYFLPRLTVPNSEGDSSLYWTSDKIGGVSPFSTVRNNSVLPSCTAYAWGRFYEIIDEEPKLSTGVANDWYSYTADGYKRGQEPRVGAVACWNNFVAIVEQVRDDGSIVTSESDWNTAVATDIWQLRERKNDDGNWGQEGFQGFIYCPTLELDTSPKISNFKVDSSSATEATISFLADNYKTINYTVLKGESEIKSGEFIGKTAYKTISLTDLIPDTEYIIKVKAKNKEGETVLRELFFTTEQDYPTSATKINFKVDNTNSKFTLDIAKPTYLGYWKTNSGYDIQLIVNNKAVKTITEKNATKNINWTSFNLQDKFSYNISLGDNIQIGVRVWVKDDGGTKIYDNTKAKTSNAICLLRKPVKLYLNK